MSSLPVAQPQGDRPLTLAQIVGDLSADQLVPKEEAEKLVANRRYSRTDVHPLVVIADQKWKDPRNPRKLLGVETLTQWIAEKSCTAGFRPRLAATTRSRCSTATRGGRTTTMRWR